MAVLLNGIPARTGAALGAPDLTSGPVDTEGALVEALGSPGLTGMVGQQRCDHGDALARGGGDQVGGGVTGVEVVLARLDLSFRQAVLDAGGGGHVRRGRHGGGHVRDQVRTPGPGPCVVVGAVVAGLGEVDWTLQPHQWLRSLQGAAFVRRFGRQLLILRPMNVHEKWFWLNFRALSLIEGSVPTRNGWWA
ncbi:hypothetical protein [Kitasatospora sp. NPDC005856]|uniref:hypothetical protein n=1 Tax=Kitasatospora sp. NPDC005856 TaxID=3154566 RepID=UPI0033E23E69